MLDDYHYTVLQLSKNFYKYEKLKMSNLCLKDTVFINHSLVEHTLYLEKKKFIQHYRNIDMKDTNYM